MKEQTLSLKQYIKMTDITYYENTRNSTQKAFVALHSNCSLCTTNLELAVVYQDNGEIREEAHCPQCELRMRSKNHIIQ